MRATSLRAMCGIGAALALGLAGGACTTPESVPLAPEARWTPVETAGVVVGEDGTTVTLDFGTVRLGSRVAARLDVTNAGSAAMTVAPPALPAPFSADVPAGGLVVGVGETRPVAITYAPETEDAHRWEGTFGIEEDAAQVVSVRLAGVSEAPAFTCDTDRLDFGNVVKSRRKTLTVSCHNGSAVEGVLVFGELTGEQPGQFSHPFTGEGRQAVAPGETLAIDVTYQASREGGASAVLPIESEVDGSLESVVRLRLTGHTLEHVVGCTPRTIDFGFVAPEATAHAELVCTNLGSDPFHLTGADLDVSSDPRFAVAGAVFPVELPPAVGAVPGEVRLDVSFSPEPEDESTRLNGVLVIGSDDPGTPRIDVALTGFAGGPVIACTPAAIDFGVVAKGMPASRAFVCTNSGTDDPARTDDALLVEAVESTHPVEFRAEVRGGLDPAGYPVGGTFTVDVTYDPADDGVDLGAIRLLTNAINATGGPHEVSVSGSGRDLPPCDFSIIPEELRFGIVDKGRTATLEFTVRNHLIDAECLIQDLRLDPTCDPAFSLPAGEVPLAVLPPSSELRFPVSFAPTEYREEGFSCDVLFDISDPADPHQVVHVRGASQAPCALIAPNDLDFGTVEPWCATRDREFEIVNMCGAPLVIGVIELAETASDEFFIRSFPPPGTTVAPGLSARFTMAYRAVDLGIDLGAVFVHVDGTAEPYSAMLRGQGAHGAEQHELFEQNDRPKVDVLWVIDNSGSMGWVHSALAANLGPFLSFADAQSIDYHIAATTTGLAPGGSGCHGGAEGGEDGRFFPVDNSRPRILTPNTPDLADNWAYIVTPGTCGGTGQHMEQVFEAAYRALHTPVIDHCDDPRHPEANDGNCGFLRPEAHLSIIGVTDEPEQSPRTVNFYYNAFQSLKGFRARHLFNFHAIAGPEHVGCSNASACNGCAEMVRKTEGGVFQSICAPDWNESLREMSAAAFGFKTCFTLASEPADQNGNGFISDREGELEVSMNGRVLASRGDQGQRIWSYDMDQNAVCFDPLAVPEPGTQLEINYKVACISW